MPTEEERHLRLNELERQIRAASEAPLRARIATLERELQEERARGVVAREALKKQTEKIERWGPSISATDAASALHKERTRSISEIGRSALSDPFPAAQALLELAEAAVRRRFAEKLVLGIERDPARADEYDAAECARVGAEVAEDAAVDRWWEVSRG